MLKTFSKRDSLMIEPIVLFDIPQPTGLGPGISEEEHFPIRIGTGLQTPKGSVICGVHN